MVQVILALHILGGMISFGVIAVGLVQLVAKRPASPVLQLALTYVPLLQIVSGILLVATQPNISIAAVCARGLALMAVMYAVRYQLQRASA